jgi:hypothetical protein
MPAMLCVVAAAGTLYGEKRRKGHKALENVTAWQLMACRLEIKSVQRSRSEAGQHLGDVASFRSRLLYLDVRRFRYSLEL